MRFQSLGQEDPLEKEMATHSSIQYARVDNPMARGAWWATVHRVAKSQTQLRWLSKHVFSWWLSSKECAFQCRRCGFHPLCQEDPLEQGNGYPLQYSCLENSMEPGGLQSKGLPKSDMTECISNTHTCIYLTFWAYGVKFCLLFQSLCPVGSGSVSLDWFFSSGSYLSAFLIMS